MFILGLIYLFILIVWLIAGVPSWRSADGSWHGPVGSVAQFVLFLIIGFVLFWSVLNR